MITYHPFIIRIRERENKRTGETLRSVYPVEAEFQGIERCGEIPVELPLLESRESQQVQTWLEKAYIDREYAKDLGSRLFYTLFPPPILEMFREAKQRIGSNERLRIVLNLPMPDTLAELPWELIFDAQGEHGFLTRSHSAPLVRRYTNVPFPHPRPQHGPLRVLVVTASPKDAPQLSIEEETEEIVQALQTELGLGDTIRLFSQHVLDRRSFAEFIRRLRQGRRFEVSPPLHHATKTKLQDRIREANSANNGFHVIHFVGHGGTDADGAELLLEDEEGNADPIQATEFAELISGPELNLVVLNACESANATNLFQSVAMANLRRGVPAVIGMQVPILDRVAIDFSREFYRALAAGEPIELAVAYARRLIGRLCPGAAADWSIPVLYMGHTGGLTMQPLEKARRVLKPMRIVNFVYAAFVTVVALLMLVFFDVPELIKAARTDVPILRCAFPIQMSSDFNIAISEFITVNENGTPIESKDGKALAEFLFTKLRSEFDRLDIGIPYEIRSPGETCRVKGSTGEERNDFAKTLADRMNAHVVVYGVITDVGDQSWVALDFLVNYAGFEGADEIAGPHALGSRLPIELPFDPKHYQGVERLALSERITAISLLAIGLAYESKDNAELALDFFQRAEETRGWSPMDRGKAILHLWLGHAYKRLATERSDSQYLSTALEHFEEALSIDPTYARAKFAQSTVLYLLALGGPEVSGFDAVDWKKLEDAADGLRIARTLGSPSESANLEAKVHYQQGLIDFVRAQKYGSEWLTKAEDEFRNVLEEYDNGNWGAADCVGHAYAYLGLIAWHRGDMNAAVDNIKKATELVSPHHQAEYYAWLGEAYASDGQRDRAAEAYERAVWIATFYTDDESAADYVEELEKLQVGFQGNN